MCADEYAVQDGNQVRIEAQALRFIELYAKATYQKDERAAFRLAQIYLNRKEKDTEKKAFTLLKKAAAQNHAEAQLLLGICYENGSGVKRNYQQAVKWYKAVGHTVSIDVWNHPGPIDEAENEILQMYCESPRFADCMDKLLDAQHDPEEDTFEYALSAAGSGDAEAQARLGVMYSRSSGADRNMEMALYWLRQSAEQDCEAGVLHLAEYYERVKKYAQAARWFRRYAELQLEWRKRRLGW